MDKNDLKEFCIKNGLDLMGVCGVEPYMELEKVIKSRIKNGYVTGMEEEVIEKRIAPKSIMESAKTIIVFALPYYIGEVENSNLSKYCYGKDYHMVFNKKLETICEFLKENINDFEYKIFVDNGPLVDRYLAYLSGIGYYGINNSIITDKYGSYVFIGYIITNYNFEVDKPLYKTCMKCGRCVRECPSKAILGNFEMNPKRCLSYVTQKKEELTDEEKSLIKSSGVIFGCDICQDVCPHNKNIKETNIEEFKNDLITNLDYEEINSISNREFKRKYKDRAFSWRGKNVIKRNLEILMEE